MGSDEAVDEDVLAVVAEALEVCACNAISAVSTSPLRGWVGGGDIERLSPGIACWKALAAAAVVELDDEEVDDMEEDEESFDSKVESSWLAALAPMDAIMAISKSNSDWFVPEFFWRRSPSEDYAAVMLGFVV